MCQILASDVIFSRNNAISSLKQVSNVLPILSPWCWGKDFLVFRYFDFSDSATHASFEPSWMIDKVQIKGTSEKYFALRYRGSIVWTRWGTKFNLGWTKTFLTMANVNTAIFEHWKFQIENPCNYNIGDWKTEFIETVFINLWLILETILFQEHHSAPPRRMD